MAEKTAEKASDRAFGKTAEKVSDRASDNTAEAELRERILQGTIRVFNRKGLKLTMDELSEELSMSKKTIYTVFSGKTELFLSMVDYLFDRIKEDEAAVAADESLTTTEKIRAVLGVLPESYREIDLRGLYELKDKYPDIYRRVEERLESGWEMTMSLLQQGMDEGVIRPVNLLIFKMMMEAALEQFFARDILLRCDYTYAQGLEEVVDILLKGIEV